MKQIYLTPTLKETVFMHCFHLLQQHSVNSFKKTEIRYVGDTNEDVEPASNGSQGARYVGDIDEE